MIPIDDTKTVDTSASEQWRRRFGSGLGTLAAAFSLTTGTVASTRAIADSGVTFPIEQIQSVSGMKHMEKTPLESFGIAGALSDLLIRCWANPSEDWGRFAGRFEHTKCSSDRSKACHYLDVFRAFLKGRVAIRALLERGDETAGLAVAMLFAAEPATRDRLMSMLPAGIAKSAGRKSARLNWLWHALGSNDFFLTLAHEHAHDMPSRRAALGSWSYKYLPFLTVGRSLSFSRRRELEASAIRTAERIGAHNGMPSAFDCDVGYAFARMSEAVYTEELGAALNLMASSGCAREMMQATRVRPVAYLPCCDWHVESVVAAAWHANDPGPNQPPGFLHGPMHPLATP